MRPPSTSGIDALPERLDAEPLDGIDKQFVRPLPQFEISGGNVLDDVGNLPIGDRGTDQRAKRGILIGLAAENADMADVMMAAGIDAAGYIDVQPAQVALQIEIAEAARDLLRDRDRAGIGEAAIV